MGMTIFAGGVRFFSGKFSILLPHHHHPHTLIDRSWRWPWIEIQHWISDVLWDPLRDCSNFSRSCEHSRGHNFQSSRTKCAAACEPTWAPSCSSSLVGSSCRPNAISSYRVGQLAEVLQLPHWHTEMTIYRKSCQVKTKWQKLEIERQTEMKMARMVKMDEKGNYGLFTEIP